MAVIDERVAARIEGDFVLFLICMRIKRPWKVTKWLPVFLAMPRMLKELETAPREETGFLGHNGLSLGTIVQYWRSFDDLERYARSRAASHWPAWVERRRRRKAPEESSDVADADPWKNELRSLILPRWHRLRSRIGTYDL